MAVQLICDGCGMPQKDIPFQERGYAKTRTYCEDCIVTVDSLLVARDTLHDSLAKQWHAETWKLAGKFKKQFPNGKMPDE